MKHLIDRIPPDVRFRAGIGLILAACNVLLWAWPVGR